MSFELLGNLMVTLRDGRVQPVLLDFGMTISFEEKRRVAYAQMIHSLYQLDLSAFTSAMKRLGYANSQSEAKPERDLEFFSFILRDTGDRKDQKASASSFFEKRKRQREKDKEDGFETKGEWGHVFMVLWCLARLFLLFPPSVISQR